MITHDQQAQPSKNEQIAHLGRPLPVGRLILAIATTGRRDVLTQTLARLELQTVKPDLLILSIANNSDIDRTVLETLSFPHEVKMGPKGACFQRNQVVSCLQPDDILLFTDDDFLMSCDYLEKVEQLFHDNPQVVMSTGSVIADGIGTSGISFDQGVELLNHVEMGAAPQSCKPVYNGYGCNMAMRANPIIENNLRFDEKLPFYSWLEDVDFSRQLSNYGDIVKSSQLTGVHLGTKLGRTSGKLLGYSQVSNPLYLCRKGTMHRNRAWRIMRRNIAANCIKSLRPEPWVDRRGRLYGNILAFIDLLRGRLAPDRILDLR